MPTKRPKYHFLTVVTTKTGKRIVAMPGQTFGQKAVTPGVLVKDVKGGTIVANVRKTAKEGDVFFTTTLKQADGCLVVQDIYRLDDQENIFAVEAREYYEKYRSGLPKSSPVIEDWWKHNGCYDREQASGIPYGPYEEEPGIYLEITDNWWDGLSADKKEKVYNEFFEES